MELIFIIVIIRNSNSRFIFIFFLFVDKRQRWNYLIYLPLLLVWITGLVFFILGLMQGNIIL